MKHLSQSKCRLPKCQQLAIFFLVISLFVLHQNQSASGQDFPPGWLPIQKLSSEPSWREVRDDDEHIQIYFPDEKVPVRGIFVCFVFHSGDPRELADLWNFALVTVPWPFEFDLGVNDKRNGRFKLGHESQDMSLLIRYLDHVADKTDHPELTTVPFVGWLGQNGSRLCADLYSKVPDRVLAWSDSFPNRLRQFPELTKNVPFAFAWEVSNKEIRAGVREYKKDKSSPSDLSCRATTYGHGHGIYSKFNFFMFYLDRCIQLRMPDKMPKPGHPVQLKKIARDSGWLGDFDPISGWNPIGPASDLKLQKSRYPVWLPDEYSAWAWRSYHSSCKEIEIAGPKVAYRKKDGKWGGTDCGLGYAGYLSASQNHTFKAKVKNKNLVKVHYYDGNQLLATTTEPGKDNSWHAKNIKLNSGLRVLYVVGEFPDGSKQASRPALVIVREHKAK